MEGEQQERRREGEGEEEVRKREGRDKRRKKREGEEEGQEEEEEERKGEEEIRKGKAGRKWKRGEFNKQYLHVVITQLWQQITHCYQRTCYLWHREDTHVRTHHRGSPGGRNAGRGSEQQGGRGHACTCCTSSLERS